MRPENRGDRRNIWLLGLVSLINDTSSKTILPLLPLFIQQLGGAGLAVGLVSGLGDSVASLLKMFAGYWSDRVGRHKAFVFWGYLTSACAKMLLAVAASWPQVLVLRLAERFGKGVRAAPRDALLAAATVRERRGRGFGIHRAMDSGGAVVGTLLAFASYWYLGYGLAQIFLIAGVIGLAALLPLLWLREDHRRITTIRPTLDLRRLAVPLRRFVSIAFLFALANFSYMFFVLRSQHAFDGRLAVAAPILLYGLYNLMSTLFAVPAGMLSDRIGRRRVLLLGYGSFALVCAGFVLFTTPSAYIGLFMLLGVNFALVEATERALVADLADPDQRGTALGAYHMITSLAALPAGLIAGALWDRDPLYTFCYGAVLALAATVLLLRLPDRLDHHG